MIRELKFRAWYEDKFHYNIEKHHVKHHSMSGWGGEVWDFSDWLKYAKVQQYTGLKDKNDVEICEGDIIKVKTFDGWFDKIGSDINHEVFWSDVESAFCYSRNKDGYGVPLRIYDQVKHEVVGNIFQNPELLKQ